MISADVRSTLWQEGIAMTLYVAVVMPTGIVALPQGDEPSDDIVALAAVWGGAAALAVAHVFAFGLATRVVHGVGQAEHERFVAVAQVAGALAVAAVVSFPILIAAPERRFDVVLWLLAAIIAATGYLAARRSGATRMRAVATASVVLVLGAAVVTVKLVLGH